MNTNPKQTNYFLTCKGLEKKECLLVLFMKFVTPRVMKFIHRTGTLSALVDPEGDSDTGVKKEKLKEFIVCVYTFIMFDNMCMFPQHF